jgi:hypothetical protein
VTTPNQPPVLLTPAAQPAGTGTGPSTVTVEGSITLTIANHTFTLTGTLGQHMIVEYHAAFEDSISLGSIGDIATQIATAVGFSGFADEIKAVNGSLSTNVPVLSSIAMTLTSASVRITDLEINTQTSTYGVGLALDFTTSSPAPMLLGIELLSLGFKVTKVNPTPATGS